MKSLVNRIAMMAASALVLGTMAYGQTEMKAQIPFAFHTVSGTLSAGDYVISRDVLHNGAPIVSLSNKATRKTVVVAGISSGVDGGSAAVLFQCTEEGGCVLAGIRAPGVNYAFKTGPRSPRDREAKTVAIALSPVHAD